MPRAATVHRWAAIRPDFRERLRRAWEIAQAATPETLKVARLQFDVIRWRASRVAPKAYRDDEAEDEPRGFEIYVQDFSTGEILSGPRHVGPGGR